jgi:ribosomal protein L40E
VRKPGDDKYRLERTDDRYGHVCPECASPKTVQAARCQRCYIDALRARFADRPARVRPSRATGASSARPQPQSHPWRKRIARDVHEARRKREAA